MYFGMHIWLIIISIYHCGFVWYCILSGAICTFHSTYEPFFEFSTLIKIQFLLRRISGDMFTTTTMYIIYTVSS